MAARSTNAAVACSRRRGASAIAHQFRQPADRSLEGHSRGISRTSGHAPELLMRVVELDVRDDELAIRMAQAGESRAIPSVCFVCQRTVERRRSGVAEQVRRGVADAAPGETAMFVADA